MAFASIGGEDACTVRPANGASVTVANASPSLQLSAPDVWPESTEHAADESAAGSSALQASGDDQPAAPSVRARTILAVPRGIQSLCIGPPRARCLRYIFSPAGLSLH